MKICVCCRREMKCIKNGVGADFGHGHIYPGDKFICLECGHEVVDTGNTNAFQDPEHKTMSEYIEMVQGPIKMTGIQWWGYRHTSGTIHIKRFFGQLDIAEAKDSPFVAKVEGPIVAENRGVAEELLTVKLREE